MFARENLVFLAVSPGLVDTATLPRECSCLECLGGRADERLGSDAGEGAAVRGYGVDRDEDAYSDWDDKLLTPKSSVRAVLGVVDKAGRDSSGGVL